MALDIIVAQVLIYLTMTVFLIIGIYAGYTKTKTKEDFLSSKRTQTAIPLAANWFAANLGSSVLYAYPEVGAISGLLGNFWYALGSTVPLWVFAWLGPMLRKKCPEGFTLTAFILTRFGRINQIYISLMTMAYMLCFMISELSAVSSILNLLANIDGLVPIIMIAVTTTIYTAYGGFRASLFTDTVQGWAIILLLLISVIGFGTSVKIDQSKIDQSRLLKSNKLGWELMYIMPVAVTFSNLFHEGYWQRAFSSKDDRELMLSSIYGSIMLFPTLFLIGFTGMIAYWAGTWVPDEFNTDAGITFFSLYTLLPDWVKGFIVVLTVSLSCSAYDTLQSAMVATMSNDIFDNRLPLIIIRCFAIIINIPVVYFGQRNLDILIVFLIADLLAVATMPPIFLGLVDSLYFLNWFDSLIGGIGGLLSIFIFGTAYYGDAYNGVQLFILPDGFGLYSDTYSTLGAFLVAPFGAVLFTFLAFGGRMLVFWIIAIAKGREFEFPKRPLDEPVEHQIKEKEKDPSKIETEDRDVPNILIK